MNCTGKKTTARCVAHCTPMFVLALLLLHSGCNSDKRAARRTDSNPMPYGVKVEPRFLKTDYPELRVALPQIADAELVDDDELCMTCHQTYVETFQHNVHRGQKCEQCHGPASRHLQTRGQDKTAIISFKSLKAAERSEMCLTCHEQDACSPGATWRTSPHAHRGVSCTDCHTSHYNVPAGTPPTQLADADRDAAQQHQLASFLQDEPAPDMATIRAQSQNLGAISPSVCYRCHANMASQQNIASAHQVCGAAAMDCTTCHDSHGKIRPETRTDLCMTCHQKNSPTMAWHSSTHARYQVACADCHNPHPAQNVQKFVSIQHTDIQRAPRTPMAVNEPQACYKCHPDIYSRNAMSSHHPIKEGKMVCSDCHDAHGQTTGNLLEPTVNMVCYKCHAEKQGPFAYEHPPVTENCSICHEPHGTVANNLLHQPSTFLCLRCHSGHRTGPPPAGPNHATLLGDIGTDPALQQAFFGDCTQCHSQVHGSDLPSPHRDNIFFR